MLAVQQLNPDSFLASNINGLKPWSMLALPDFAEAQATSRRQADLQVAEQNASWQSGVRDGQGVSQTAGQVRITAFDETADFQEDPVEENDESTVSTAPQAVMEEASDQALGTTSEETSDKAPEGTLAIDEPLFDQQPEPLANTPDTAQQSSAVVDDPFDLDQIEQQIRAEESSGLTRVLDTVLASGSVGLLAGLAIIVLLVVALMRRRAVQQEQELDGVLGSKNDDVSGFESDQGGATVSIAAPQSDPSEEQNENGAFATEELQGDDDSGQEDVFTTRLKLAEAYIEMGDEDGARDMLQEVIADGSAEQQDVARRIVARLDGGDD
jgi:FimV-like protein